MTGEGRELFRAVPVRSFAIDRHHSLIMPGGARQPLAVATLVARVLQRCLSPRTLVEHETAVGASLPGVDRRFIHKALTSLVRAGLIRPLTDIAPRIPPAALSVAVFISHGHARMTERCLTSYLAQAEREGHDLRCVVVDTSRNLEAAGGVSARVCWLSQSCGAAVEYWGPVEIANLARELRELGHAAAATALTDVSSGMEARAAARLLALLVTAGRSALVIDVATVCETWSPKAPGTALALRGHSDPRDYDFSGVAVPSWADGAAPGLIVAHERVVGRSLAELMGEWQWELDASDACWHIEAALADLSTRHRVRAVSSGMSGDGGAEGPHELLLKQGPITRQLCDRQAFDRAMVNRRFARITSQTTISHAPLCDLECVSLDNTTILPPFVGCHGTARAFGTMLALCDPEALFACVPVGVAYDPEAGAAYTEMDDASIGSTGIADIMVMALADFGASSTVTDGAVRLRCMGDHMASVAATPTDFSDWLRSAVLQIKSSELGSLDRLVHRTDLPPHYRAAAAKYRSTLLTHLDRDSFCVPAELRANDTVESGAPALRSIMQRHASLLQEWGSLWDYAKGREW